jgi:hypothetical protein
MLRSLIALVNLAKSKLEAAHVVIRVKVASNTSHKQIKVSLIRSLYEASACQLPMTAFATQKNSEKERFGGLTRSSCGIFDAPVERMQAFLTNELIIADKHFPREARSDAADIRTEESSFVSSFRPINTPHRCVDKRRVLRRDKPRTRFVTLFMARDRRGMPAGKIRDTPRTGCGR